MKWSYRIATVAGIEVRIHATFVLILVFYGWNYYQQGGWPAAFTGIAFTLSLFLCVLLHEFGHAFAARYFGIRTPDITLLPIGGLARLERMPKNPWEELCIAVAGPMVNVVIAVGVFLFLKGHYALSHLDRIGNNPLVNLMTINVGLVLFNLIPAFPMDGGRVLRALLAFKLPHSQATRIAARLGQGIAVLFALASFTPFGSQLLLLIAFFVFFAAQQELVYSTPETIRPGTTVGDVMITQFQTLSDFLRLGEVAAFLKESPQSIFPVVDERMHFQGLATREQLLKAAEQLSADTPAAQIARAVPEVTPDMALAEAVGMMNQRREPVVPVLNPARQIVGLLVLPRE